MYNIAEITNTIISGHALAELKKFPSDSIDCVITSSPYLGLRTYDTEPQIWGGDFACQHTWEEHIQKPKGGRNLPDNMPSVGNNKTIQKMDNPRFGVKSNFCLICGAWLGELGQEPTPKMFVDHLVEIFMECARVLKPKGTMWINIADSYSGSNQGNGAPPSGKNATNRGTSKMQLENHKSTLSNLDIPKKSLIGIPDRLKIALIDNGLICRNEIIWHKPNQMPSSAKDKFTPDYEKLYFFTKSKKYYFEQQLEPYTKPMNRWAGDILAADGNSEWDEGTGQSSYRNRNMRPNSNGKNMRSVWSINTVPSKIKHFAMFPEKLIERPILAGCPVLICKTCGKTFSENKDICWCGHDNFETGIVLDPFMGSGTTARVAKKNMRNYIGIELNPEYAEVSRKSLQ